jgi:putative ABC transport system permease protein
MMNLRSIPERSGTSLVVVIGIAGVVAVLIAVMALASGLSRTLAGTGSSERAIMLYRGAQSEIASGIAREVVSALSNLPGIKKDGDGKPMISADALASTWLPTRDTGELGSVTFRGISYGALAVRPEIGLIEGRLFEPGMRELIAGRTAAVRFDGLRVGDRVTLNEIEWLIVGVFGSNGDAHESELISDADSLMSAYKRSVFNSVTARLESPTSFTALKDSVSLEPTLVIDVLPEVEFFKQQSEKFGSFLTLVANAVGFVMAIGAVFAALNTMYSAVSSRTREIATLRALGFGSGGVVVSVLVEALALAVLGAIVGAGLAWSFFNGSTISTVAGSGGVGQIAFNLRVGADLVFLGIAWACVVGLIGGLFPAIRAARLPVAASLRAT